MLLQEIAARIEYLTEAAKRLGRKDWYGIMLSQVLTIAVTVAMNSNEVKALLEQLTSILRPLFTPLGRIMGQ